MDSKSDCASKCPFDCPIVKKICCALGFIGIIAALYLWFTTSDLSMELAAHRERLAIFVLLFANMFKRMGKGRKCHTTASCDDKGSCEIKPDDKK